MTVTVNPSLKVEQAGVIATRAKCGSVHALVADVRFSDVSSAKSSQHADLVEEHGIPGFRSEQTPDLRELRAFL